MLYSACSALTLEDDEEGAGEGEATLAAAMRRVVPEEEEAAKTTSELELSVGAGGLELDDDDEDESPDEPAGTRYHLQDSTPLSAPLRKKTKLAKETRTKVPRTHHCFVFSSVSVPVF